jgi:transglutaminase-like putative cysteine protease
MILEIQHETRFTYAETVTEAIAEVRLEPVSDAEQSCHSFHLSIAPGATLHRYSDGFGNRVHHFNLLSAHREVRVLSASVVETHSRPENLGPCRATLPLDPGLFGLDVLDFLPLRGPVTSPSALKPLLEALQPRPGYPLTEFAMAVSHYIHEHFVYAPDVTLATSPIDDVLALGKGVCQDFTHLMIAILRSFGVPARYVSGYIHRENAESQSHAWCELWLPEVGWRGVDPTNNRVVDGSFVKVGIGRDFTDVPPNKGIYRGSADQSISVRVETRALDRLPSLSWQEQLPALNIPLIAIRGPARCLTHPDEEESQQQQQ